MRLSVCCSSFRVRAAEEEERDKGPAVVLGSGCGGCRRGPERSGARNPAGKGKWRPRRSELPRRPQFSASFTHLPHKDSATLFVHTAGGCAGCRSNCPGRSAPKWQSGERRPPLRRTEAAVQRPRVPRKRQRARSYIRIQRQQRPVRRLCPAFHPPYHSICRTNVEQASGLSLIKDDSTDRSQVVGDKAIVE